MSLVSPAPDILGAPGPVRPRWRSELAHKVRGMLERVQSPAPTDRLPAAGVPAEVRPQVADPPARPPTLTRLPPSAGAPMSHHGLDRGAPALSAGTDAWAAPGRAWAAPGTQPPNRHVQFILVVEADPADRQAIVQSLEGRGYFVLAARSVREASALFVVQPALLIVASRLPDASGWDLLDWLALCGRQLPVVMIGERESAASRPAPLRPVQVLAQPFALETLIAIVQEHVLTPAAGYGA